MLMSNTLPYPRMVNGKWLGSWTGVFLAEVFTEWIMPVLNGANAALATCLFKLVITIYFLCPQLTFACYRKQQLIKYCLHYFDFDSIFQFGRGCERKIEMEASKREPQHQTPQQWYRAQT